MSRPGPGPRAVRALAVLLLGGLLAACATFGSATELTGRLLDDGFGSPQVGFSTGTGGDEVTVSSAGHRSLPAAAATTRAAEIVWRSFPRRLDRVVVEVAGSGATLTATELTARFGPRDPALDATSMGDDAGDSLRTAALVVAVVVLVGLVGLGLLVVWLVRRSRRQRPGPPPPPPPRPPFPPPFPPGPPGPPPPAGGRPPR